MRSIKSLLIFLKLFFTLLIFYYISSCTGSKGFVVFNNLKYPASFSPFLYKENKILLQEGKDMTVVGKLKKKKVYYSVFYKVANFNKRNELGDMLNDSIQKAGGDAIINFQFGTRNCILNYAIGFNFLPFWPGCTVIKMRGDIVKLKFINNG